MAANTFLDERSVALLLDVANVACHNGYPGEAREIVDGVLAERPDFPPARITLAFTHLVVDEFDQAHEILNDVLAKNPNDADALFLQGFAYYLAGDTSMADQAFDALPKDAPQRQMVEALRCSA